MAKKVSSILFVTMILIIIYVNRDQFVGIIKEGGMFSIWISMLMVAMGAFFPIVPFPILGGIIGAVFGVWQGALISLAGGMLGTTVFFLLVRYGFRNVTKTYIMKYETIKKYEAIMLKKPFLAVYLSRMIPVIPATVVNMTWALSDVSIYAFFVASSLGKIPNILLVNYAGSIFMHHQWGAIVAYAAYMAVIGASYYVVFFKMKSREKTEKLENE
ncbi:TVP38/TMEM64 family protein [Ectobacillus sp. sgz5001026]|uniref:TVP38/TMEM64 family protein n=1 Tax=Ectobacillus sp. sgz5001026 TaxID=3242473 RepID=UPI0036D29A16